MPTPETYSQAVKPLRDISWGFAAHRTPRGASGKAVRALNQQRGVLQASV